VEKDASAVLISSRQIVGEEHRNNGALFNVNSSFRGFDPNPGTSKLKGEKRTSLLGVNTISFPFPSLRRRDAPLCKMLTADKLLVKNTNNGVA